MGNAGEDVNRNKSMRFFWRIVAIASTSLWSILLFANLAFPVSNMDSNVFPRLISNALPLFSIFASIVLIVFPMQFYIYAVMCCLWGLSILIDIGSTSAILMYLLGCAFAYNKYFFSKCEPKHDPIKYLMLLVPLLIIIAFQYRLGIDELLATIFDILFLLVFFVLAYFLVIVPFFIQKKVKHAEQTNNIDSSGLTAEEILRLRQNDEKFSEQAEEILRLKQNDEKLSEQAEEIRKLKETITNLTFYDLRELPADELLMLNAVINNKTLVAISQDNSLHESTIKRQIADVYKKVGIYGRSHLLDLYKNGKLIFPE